MRHLPAKDIYNELQSLPGPLFHSPSPVAAEGKIPRLQSEIASLLVHPLLEAALHLLNHSLYAPHFLLRKMQNSRGGQHLHGVLHRVEGDYENARIWYREASGTETPPKEVTNREREEVFVEFWSKHTHLLQDEDENGQQDKAHRARAAATAFIDRVQQMKEQSKGQVFDAGLRTPEREELERISKAELNTVAEWAGNTFGWGSWGEGDGEAKDASGAYTGNTKEQKEIFMKQMGEGIRKF
ncbi:hypothetical protein GLOTRDRAFT_129221 [Gloeophyllum trabeum ATCC 11539]|uniref:Uncharacterized protein n=1 Tax=Gloeophyllum trabeum (strain ATCC 11539 / FP-39264 / Madison 617) TaxID=670483 RepID=S7Q9J9_GLOTA|nr:uncharacterized protein GLOTRDRAFT_129221 [Gloeophyllum trabeum ATCC 11539]EPQ56018.1 hypothetical protein GLOTRDRAFT_129221 [Gloeophyllum trabeum ATCC 11539]